MYVNFKQVEPILKDIVSTPTSPFREDRVIEKILTYLKKFGLNIMTTKYNNIIVSFGRKDSMEDIYFISHTDHPGFLVQEDNKKTSILKVMGGVPFHAKNFKKVAEIDILTGKRYVHNIKKVIKKENGVFVETKNSKDINPNNIFTLNLKSYYKRNDTIYAHAIDDLGGCSAQIAAVSYLSKHKKDLETNVHFVFTRAEEVGFIGIISLIKNGYLPKNGYYISCETSKCISPVQFGKGVVLRLGDKAGIFEQQFTNSLFSYFQKKALLEKYPIQRALLDGGTCEATPLVVNNFKASGFACPLGNYHNLSDDNTIKEEYINANDFTSYVNTIIETSLNFSKIIKSYNKYNIQKRVDKNYKTMEQYFRRRK